MSRAVPPERITTLHDWVARWPKATNLKFNPETRVATVYSTAGAEVRSFPWEREGDVLTVLTSPERFTGEMVTAAKRRYDRHRDNIETARATAEGPMRDAERALLEAWQAYRAADRSMRDSLRPAVLAAEATVRTLEEKLAKRVYSGREVMAVEANVGAYEKIVRKSGAVQLLAQRAVTGVYVPPFPVNRRGMESAESLGETPPSSSEGSASEETAGSEEFGSSEEAGSDY